MRLTVPMGMVLKQEAGTASARNSRDRRNGGEGQRLEASVLRSRDPDTSATEWTLHVPYLPTSERHINMQRYQVSDLLRTVNDRLRSDASISVVRHVCHCVQANRQ